jgi:septal ring factor EnvC (AmiA/AmiB activator)
VNIDDQIAELRKQIEDLETVGQLEAELIEAKANLEPGSEELREIKLRLREARREQRAGREPGTANPETIEATATVDPQED